jgi:hypothetical protein
MNAKSKRFFCSGLGIALVIGILIFCAGGAFALSRVLPEIRSRITSRSTAVPIPIESNGSVEPGIAATEQAAAAQMSVRLSEGQAQPYSAQTLGATEGEPLTDEEIEAILARLPELPEAATDQTEFHLAQQPIPPPRTGQVVEQPFPPEEEAALPGSEESGPLEVLRYSPEGEIPLAPFLSVTFNQPMVPLGTLADLAALEVPVRIEPALEGTWRWLGTKTLTFEYDSELIDRLPKATVYHVTVPAGTKSAIGGVLAESVEWTFSTPAPVAVTMHPSYSPQSRDPLFFVAFDQRIDPEAVLETIQVTAAGEAVQLRIAEEGEIKKDSQVSQMIKYAQEGRWLAFRATETLPADTSIVVTIGPGTPSAEGPLVTQAAQSYSFSTYAPLRIDWHGCSWSEPPCQPLTPLSIRFNNPIDPNAYHEAMLTVEPEIPGVVVNIYGNTVEIHGPTQGSTTYKVTVDGDIQDIYGQTLGEDTTLTFKVGPAESLLVGPGQIFMTMDPAAPEPLFSVYAINYNTLELRIYSVQPEDWPAYKEYLRQWQQTDQPPEMPGEFVVQKTLRPEMPADTLTQVDIPLAEYMDGDYGHLIVVVEPPKGLIETNDEKWQRFSQTVHTWVQITDIGLDAYVDHSEMIAWATSLENGAPLAGVTIHPQGGGRQSVTGEDGVVRTAIPSGATYLVASKGADRVLLPRSSYYWGEDAWNKWPVNDWLQWYVFDDRQMYRPGEEVHLKGWIRLIGGKQTGDVGLPGERLSAVYYRVTDPQGNELVSGQADVNALGGFDFVIEIPEAVNLGYAQVELSASGDLSGWDGTMYYHSFQIQEFRRPEFEVAARNETSGPYFAGDHAILAVQAKYYAGDPLPDAEVTWQVSYTPGTYTPPNWPEFTFGVWQPWWFWYEDFYYGYYGEPGTVETFSGKTDATGTHYLRLDFEGQLDMRPLSVVADATVMDVNRQAWSSGTSLLVHPASLYVGLRSDRYFVEQGDPLKIELIVTDLDGEPVADRPVEVTAARLEWKYRAGTWQEEEADVQNCIVGSTSEPVSCTFETPVGGTYRITATVVDEMGRKNQSQFTRWVSGGEQPPSRNVEQEKVTLVPDKEIYQPGDVAEILVQSPFTPAEGLLTVSRSGILYTERFTIDDGTVTLRIPIEEAHLPNLNIQVDLAGSAQRTDDQGEPLPDVPRRPAFATGQLSLNISTLQRVLSLEVTPLEKELEPGSKTSLDLTVTDIYGQPVQGAELAVVVVDEAILALTQYQLADPLSIFYSSRPSYLDSVYGRSSIILVDPLSLSRDAREGLQVAATQVVEEELAAAPVELPAAEADASGGKSAEGQAAQPIDVRTDFNPLAVFAPSVTTDAQGQARVAVKLPDNLTRYRVMVVAVDSGGSRFGTGESSLTARLPLMVRPSAPRFLNFGDKFELPVVLQNQTGESMEVEVVVRTANLALDEYSGLRVSVPAHNRVEVRFPASTIMAGTAHIQVAAVSGSYADAATIELPVYTPATTEAFATYGVVDEGVVMQPLIEPTGVFPQYGGLEVSTSSTALQALTDAVLYLVSYPFECSEQLASRILGVASLRDVLTAFEAEGLPSPQEMEAAVQRDIERLQGMQNGDGGFPYWRRGFESVPFNSIHVAHALYRAQSKGFEVPSDMQQNALYFLQDIESHYPDWYGQQTRWTLSAYALYVRDLSGDPDPDEAMRLLDEAGLENLSMEATGWLWSVLQGEPSAEEQLDAIRRHVGNRVVETPGAANFTTYYDDQTYLLLSSDRRTDAILLDALIGDDPKSDLIPKLVNGLLAHRTKGRWYNTQENVFVLLALDNYFNTFEAQTPNFVARLWLGDTYAGEFAFQGYSTEQQELNIPMSYVISETVAGGGEQLLTLSKEGEGRLYYRLGLRYAPSDLNLDPLDMGFVVTRRYEAVDDPLDVTQDEDGVWHIKAGARVKVVVSMVADNRRYHVALVDPLPAGLEIVNPALAVSQSTPSAPSQGYSWWWYWNWYHYQNLRDERAEAFTPLLWDGVYEYSYIARATTPGTFVVPPAKAEEMYSPEVFGRSGSDWVIIED